MGRNIKNICDIHIVPDHCRERFLPLEHPSTMSLRELNVSMAGLSDLGPGYEMGRRAPRFHLLLYTLEGGGDLYTAQGRTRLGPNPSCLPHCKPPLADSLVSPENQENLVIPGRGCLENPDGQSGGGFIAAHGRVAS
jgi:hypothetical protein